MGKTHDESVSLQYLFPREVEAEAGKKQVMARKLSREDTQMASNHMKRRPSPSAFREMHTQTTVRSCFACAASALIK